jgi:CSLREA domain-containing protein
MNVRTMTLAGLVWALGLIVPATGLAATFTVNTQVDSTVAGGCTTDPACSLRDAIFAANASADPENRVEVPAGSYPLTLGELSVSASQVTIHGAGARATRIDGQGASRVFNITADNSALEGVTVTGGSAAVGSGPFPGDGGGILVEGTSSTSFTLNQSAVVGNTAALNGGGLSAPPESINSTAVSINASTIAGNRISGGLGEGMGGGVYVLGDISIANSTIAGNSVENAGLNQGGGVLAGIDPAETEGTSASLLNTTIAGNSVAAGGVGGGFAIYNPTAGIATAFDVKNTIIAANSAGGAPADCGTVVTAGSANNISSDASCMFTDAGSKQNTDPKLGPLEDNGGPTDTLALPVGSPALDAGTNVGCPVTDQRGVTRPQGSSCDVGAYEREVVKAPPLAPAGKAVADLVVRLKPKPKHPKPGGKLALVLTLANRGPAAATGIVLTGRVPAPAYKVKGKKVGGKRPCKLAKARKGKRKLSCRLGTLAAGKKLKLKVLVHTGDAVKLRANARVRSAVADPNARNSKAKAAVRVK